MSEIIQHLEKFRDNLNKLNGKFESGYGTKAVSSHTIPQFSRDQRPGELGRTQVGMSGQPNLNLFQREVRTLVDENNSLREELKRVMSEQIEDDLSERVGEMIFPKERALLAEKKQNLAEEMCGAAMERVDQLEEEVENMKNVCDVPGLFSQLNKIQGEYRSLFEGQNEILEQVYQKLRCVEGENKLSAIQLEDYHNALERIRAQVKERCTKMDDIYDLRAIYEEKVAQLHRQAEVDAERIQGQEVQLGALEEELCGFRECVAVLQQEIGSLAESKESLAKENKKQKEILSGLEMTNLKIRQDLNQREEELESYKRQVRDIIQEGKLNAKQQISAERTKHEQDTLSTKNENMRLGQEIAELRSRLSSERDHYDKMQSESEKAKKELVDQIQQIRDSKNRQNKKMSQLSSRRDALVEENEKLKERVKQMMAKKNDEGKSFKKEIAVLTGRLKMAEREKSRSREDSEHLMEQRNKSLEEARRELRNKNRECIHLKSRLNSLSDEIREIKIDAETRIEQQLTEKESIIQEMNSLVGEEQKVSKRWRNDYEAAVAQKDLRMETLLEENKALNANNASLKRTNQKYQQEIIEREELIKRHQAQYIEAQMEVAKYRKIVSRRASP